jgi:hypothetical protein
MLVATIAVSGDQARKASARCFIDHHRQQRAKPGRPSPTQLSISGLRSGSFLNGQQKPTRIPENCGKPACRSARMCSAMAIPGVGRQGQPTLDQRLAQRTPVGNDSRHQPGSHVICSNAVFFEKPSLS